VDHIQRAGFAVEIHDLDDQNDLRSIKAAAGVPANLMSCHTAVLGDYYIEGHVPAGELMRLVEESPSVHGLAVPGMPIGSPGMEGLDPQPYEVIAWTADGRTDVYADIVPTR
jgi:hypothetical protein